MVEDRETTPEEPDAQFGRAIRGIVLAVTDDKNLPRAERRRQQIAHPGEPRRRATPVKRADKVRNPREIVERPPAVTKSPSRGGAEWRT